jgi:2-amino-4-hydroxy-6-hydroxymethyldihydropteridine diphosphokinase
MQTEVVLCLGWNKGNREKLLSQAVILLSQYFEVKKLSSIYETAAWGGVAKGDFLNQVAVVSTDMQPEEVLNRIQQIELDLGRTRFEPWGDRTMDIDILFYGEQIFKSDRLEIPHPFLAERRFVLVPLSELIPDFVHPVLKEKMVKLLDLCQDRSEIKKIPSQRMGF